eukprot:TRINITY_DN48789_c0_g1_i1.p2 TRINITY_DN48789_c0_g1~~TRINITY_DN48789_c0_g1_i1.p2  ORF type:complete len:126 (-),score=27.86 TRINITY_DN48789_c0_g1_i1:49-426(-)
MHGCGEEPGSVTVKNSFVHLVEPIDEAESPSMRRYGSESRLSLAVLPDTAKCDKRRKEEAVKMQAPGKHRVLELSHAQALVEQENKRLEALIAIYQNMLAARRPTAHPWHSRASGSQRSSASSKK